MPGVSITPKTFNNIIEIEYDDLIERINPDKEIARNFALKDNLFHLFVAILNKIPLFITGNPGCSKTLSVNLLINSLKGIDSKDRLFQELPIINP